ncbi:hypothetical protein KKI24_10305 [bacterium]|nr:hypothetical protein [bacterium]
MSGNNWWPEFRKYSQAMEKLSRIPAVVIRDLRGTVRLFTLLKQVSAGPTAIAPETVERLTRSAEKLLREIAVLKENAQQEQTVKFYTAFVHTIEAGLKELAVSPLANLESGSKPGPQTVRPAETTQETSQANQFGTQLYELKKKYLPIMTAQHEARAAKGLKSATADEADRLESFFNVCEHWLKHLYALEHSQRVLLANIGDKETPVVKDPLPLQFRLERNKPTYTIRLIKASYQQPTADDLTTLDIINGCWDIPTFNRDGKILIDHKEVIRFIRLHSKKDDLMNFGNDPLSQIASQLYDILVQVVAALKGLSENTISLINHTPMQDLEYAFAGINPDECRTLLRLKFHSLLPGINEDHYRFSQKKTPGEHSVRTIEAMEEYKRSFEKTRDQQLTSLKSSLAMSYWLRKMLLSVIRNNQTLRKKARETEGQPAENKEAAVDFSRWMLVGTSQTIGDEDIGNFYISPDDIISSQMSIQRVDRTDKWIAVRKSEKMHRIRKKDFFFVVQRLIDDDLNPALKKYGLRTVDLNHQLLPEIHERLEDTHRIEVLRSGILGTIITNLDEFMEATAFHQTLRRYFQKPAYDNIHYPTREKLRQLASGLTYSNTSILQMKYRRVLRVKEEIGEELKRLKAALSSPVAAGAEKELTERKHLIENLQKIIRKVQEILIFAKPTLKDVRLEPDANYIVVSDLSNQS